MISLIAIIFTFSVVIFVHELGHFIVALKSGVDVEVFSLGFGREIFGFTRKGVRYRISAVPLGGYVRMKGDTMEDESAGEPGSFLSLDPLRRIPVLISGAAMNYITGALILFLIIYLAGMTQVVDEPVIGGLVEGYPAVEAGFEEGDRILTVDGAGVSTWQELVSMVSERGGEVINFKVDREGEVINIEAAPEYEEASGRGFLGITAPVEEVKLGFFESIVESIRYVFFISLTLLEFLWLMITGRMEADVSGPIGIAHAVSDAARHGLISLFQLIALISVQLGLINLLPVPILDGGHIVLAFAEKVKGSALDPKKIAVANMIGVSLLIALILFATWQDILRVFQ